MRAAVAVVPTQGELDYLLQALAADGHHGKAGTLGRLPATVLTTIPLTLVRGGLGKVHCAVHMQHVLDVQTWDLAICAGAAGALAEYLAAGDVVIASDTIEHDIRKASRPLVPRFPGWGTGIRHCQTDAIKLSTGRVYVGPIASGDEDILTSDRRQQLVTGTGALAVAWEGAGAARASQFSNVPFLEVRGIADSCDPNGPTDFKANLPRTMGNVGRVLVSLVDTLSDG